MNQEKLQYFCFTITKKDVERIEYYPKCCLIIMITIIGLITSGIILIWIPYNNADNNADNNISSSLGFFLLGVIVDIVLIIICILPIFAVIGLSYQICIKCFPLPDEVNQIEMTSIAEAEIVPEVCIN
jgi:uncharacterized membrane protein